MSCPNPVTARGHRRALAISVAAASCVIALAACGSSSRSDSRAGDQAAGIRFADCMRSHGVPNFPDPSAGGGGIEIPSGVNPQSPAFQSAQSACSALMPGPLFHGHASEARKLEMLKLARCMRAHGFSTFPDPTSAPPAPGTGFGIAFGAPGSFIAVPQTMLQSPGFNQAASQCGFPGAGSHPGGKKSFAPG
jgi:hypothetical protein